MSEVHDGATLRAALEEIAGNFSFSWTPGARTLFADLNPPRFGELLHNPTALLSELTDDDLARALTPEYAIRLGKVEARLDDEREHTTWWQQEERPEDFLVAYFSAEFGLDESLPTYSGGLGILAGDHLKSASELGVPLVGIGLNYFRGYFRQRLDDGDRQTERYPRNDSVRLPLTLVPMAPSVLLADDDGNLTKVRIGVWLAKVGRVRLYLLDTKIEGNPDWARDVTNTLYGGDRQNRLRQELVLGVGGVRVLRALGLRPSVFHMNEGHSAFLQLERLRELVEDEGVDRDEALERIRASSVFTTHTPVPAGNEVFEPELVRRYLAPLVERCGFEWDEFVSLGKLHDDEEMFGMTPFALRTSAYANAVSKLHGEVSREMWHDLWPDRPVDDVPITSITNGVHVRTWISGELEGLLGTNAPACERALAASGRGPLGRAPRRQGAADGVHRADARRSRARSRRADDRLRAALRDVQARMAPAQPAGAPRGAARRHAPTDADPRRGQGAPGRRGGQGRHPAGRRLFPRRRRTQPRRLPSRLRDDARAPPRPGRRRVAEHAAPPDGGVGDVWDEGCAERRAQLLHPRRLVGGGLQRPTAASRSAPSTRWEATRSRTAPTPSRSSRCSSSR